MTSGLATRQHGGNLIPPLIGSSPAIRRVNELINRFAPTDLPVLLVGATGTGKELAARHVHLLSGRHGQLIDINCAALPRDLIDGLLFGHRRGAFSGAVDDGPGLVAEAAGGTLFLDELSSLPLEAQAKLLRVLETREVRRVGETRKRQIDFRLVSAVQEEVWQRVEDGHFRRDLYYRVNGVRIELPTLVDRPEDVGPLADYFAQAHGCRLHAGSAAVLQAHRWPGNVRELRAVIDRAAVWARGPSIHPAVLLEAMQAERPQRREAPRKQEASARQAELLQVCAHYSWDRERIAAALGVSVATLYRHLRRAGISLRHLALATAEDAEGHANGSGIAHS